MARSGLRAESDARHADLDPELPQTRILASDVAVQTFTETVDLLTRWAERSDRGRMVCLANVHMLVEARRDPAFASVLNRADLVTADGVPLVWLIRRAGHSRQDRVAGMDLLPALCAAAEQAAIRVYFFGSTPEVLATIQRKLLVRHPGLKVVGMEAPPFRELKAEEETAVLKRINDANPGFVFVALGCPRQERWMDRAVEHVNAVFIGVGAALPVYAGIRRRAPVSMQRNGLEWLFRLVQEPRRLWRRYLTTNFLFLVWLLSGWQAGKEPRAGVRLAVRNQGKTDAQS